MLEFTVSQNPAEPDAFSTIGEALSQLPEDDFAPVTVRIGAGTYREKLTVSRPNVTLIGEDVRTTVIAFDDYANQIMPDGSKRGTFRSYTLLLDGNNITLSNLTIRNDAYPRSQVGQAIALYADGDRIIVDNCRLISYQDTLFTGPLPPNPLSPGGFIGPKEFAERIVGRQYYKNCYICGDIDFIFGSAIAYFQNCEIATVYSEIPTKTHQDGSPLYGYVTAASTPEGFPYGYVFKSCAFTGACPEETVYLGRPWRNFAKTVLLDCYLGSHIKKEGFHDWNKTEAHETILYAEYHSTGKGAVPESRAPYVKQLTDEEAALYTREAVLSGEDNWCP